VISDASGRIVHQKKVALYQGNNVVEVTNFNYAAGIYHLVLVDDFGKREIIKFIKK